MRRLILLIVTVLIVPSLGMAQAVHPFDLGYGQSSLYHPFDRGYGLGYDGSYGGYRGYRGYSGYSGYPDFYGRSEAAQIIGASSSSLPNVLFGIADWKRINSIDRHLERQDGMRDRHLKRQDEIAAGAVGFNSQQREEKKIPPHVLEKCVSTLKEWKEEGKAYRKAYCVYMEALHIDCESKEEAFRKAMGVLEAENLTCYSKFLQEVFN